MKEREIRVLLHDGSEVIMNTGDRVLYQASKPGAVPLAVDADTIADDLLLTMEQANQQLTEKDATIKELEQQVKKWKSLAESKVTHVHYNDNELLRKALKFAGWDIKQKMGTKTIKTPSWVLLESLGHVNCELVDVDLEGGVVNLTVVEGDKE